jgi:hypothetical protein
VRVVHSISPKREAAVRACFCGLGLDSLVEKPSRLLAIDRATRVTCIAEGWKVYVRRYQQEEL